MRGTAVPDTGENALEALAESLATEGTLLSTQVGSPEAEPSLGVLVAGGARAAAAPAEYALLFETVREGYLLHYAEGRVLRPEDPDLALLAGDYLYARGLERLAKLGDLEAVEELADLVSLCAQIHAGAASPDRPAAALWLASANAVGCGGSPGHEAAKDALRSGHGNAVEELWSAAADGAAKGGVSVLLDRAADAIGFRPPQAGPSEPR